MIKRAVVILGSSLALTIPSISHASDWGCTVLLCLAGPWKSISECQGPVHDLFRHLAKGGSFPSCDMSDGNDDSQNFTRRGVDYVEDCPSNTDYVATNYGVIGGGYGSPYWYKECRTKQKVCKIVQGYGGPAQEVCDYEKVYQRTLRSEPNWIDTYVDGKFYQRNWWGQ